MNTQMKILQKNFIGEDYENIKCKSAYYNYFRWKRNKINNYT